MKILSILAVSAVSIMPLSAEPSQLTEPEKETLIASLDKLRNGANGEVEAKYRAAVAAFQEALESDQAAIDLHVKCTEYVDYEKKDRPTKDFREWKKRNKERMDAPGFGLALRYQLRWLLLTIYAATADDRALVAPKAAGIISSIFQSAERLQGQQNRLREGVLGTAFARAYDLGGLKVEDWVQSPLQIDAVYDKIILPQFRRPSSTDKLRAAWTNRIHYEAMIVEDMRRKSRGENKAEDKAQKLEEIRVFYNEVQPDLIWRMEEDIFKAGDQKSAAKNMLRHLREHLAHDQARQWEKAFRKLVSPEVETPTIE